VHGSTYELGVRNAAQLSRVEGAEWTRGSGGHGQLRIQMPTALHVTSKVEGEGARATADSESYTRQKVVFHFVGKTAVEHPKVGEN
jgi:hypothetical protein